MTPVTALETEAEVLPDHTQLPDEDGAIVHNFQEHPQSMLLSGSLLPRLAQLHPDGQFCVGCDSGIYWKYTQPPLNGCKAPDWFYVPGVPPMLDGQLRRSYVLWKEVVKPYLVIEYASGDGSEERDRTPHAGKFWVYEQGICAAYYAIFVVASASVELYRLEAGRYVPVPPNAAGRFPIPALGIELGIREEVYQNHNLPWLRVWDSATGTLLPSTEEREYAEKERADAEKERANSAESLLEEAREDLAAECERAEELRKRAETLAARLSSLGIDPEAV